MKIDILSQWLTLLHVGIDCRILNSIAKVNPLPMPNAEDLLHQVAEARFFSKLDLTKGYYQAPMEESSKPFTAFATSHRLYQFKMPHSFFFLII